MKVNQETIQDVPALIRSFYEGAMDIVTFRQLYDTHPEINDFLQSVIDHYITEHIPFPETINRGTEKWVYSHIKYFKCPQEYPGYIYGDRPFGCVRDYLTQEFRMCTTNVETASGALEFYQSLYDVFYHYDQNVPYDDTKYEKAFCFMLEAIPQYLSGGVSESYISKHIIPLFPDTMPKRERIKAIKQKIREEFRSEKGYPAWLQSCEWPFASDGKPAVYIGSKKKDGGESKEYYFRDETSGETITVKQFH